MKHENKDLLWSDVTQMNCLCVPWIFYEWINYANWMEAY